ncbi:MAG TPA: sulfate permease [Lapillicoccus sp.]|uniref:SulP family inorganic anion transporter n=1 Tax=Lapillicoccus sp. TaxID=1909287 RepID=UPI002F953674
MSRSAVVVAPQRWRAYVPGLAVVTSYQRSWLPKDVVAGLVLSALLVPQGMAYADLAGLPAVTGLYTSILCLLAYAVFGPSRVLVLGPDSSLGPMIAATILPLMVAGGDPVRAVALASLLAVLVGVIMVAAGLAKFGFVADLLSKPTQIGYMNGLALTIIVGQLPKLLGFSVDADGLVAEARAFVSGLAQDEANTTAAVVGVASLAGILLLNRLLPKLPSVLIVVVLAAVAVNALDLQEHGVDTVGVIPQGFPPFTVPAVTWGDLPPLLLGALAIAVVALADTMSTASAFAARRGEQVRGNQEMVGIGAANIAAGFFQGFPVSTSGSRTAVAEQAGSRSQVTGVVGAGVITLVLVFATGAMEFVPQPTLGAIVIVAALSLADVAGTRRLWRQRRMEFTLSVIALLGVALLGVLPGILIAVGLSILNVFRRTWWPHHTELGRVDGVAGLHDTERYPDAEMLPGLVVYRFDAPLIFANARMFGEAMRGIAQQHQDLRWIVIAAEPITDVDTTASDMLHELDLWLNQRGVSLVFAEMKDPVRDKIEQYELTDTIDPAHFFPTLDAALAEYLRQTGAVWPGKGAGS